MNYDDFEALVRDSVDDASTDSDYIPTWADDEIAKYTNLALSNWSNHFPQQLTDSINVVAGQRSYSLPSDIITPPDNAIVDARWQRSTYQYDHMRRVQWKPGRDEHKSMTGTGKGYMLWGGNFVLEDTPTAGDAGYDIELWYYGVHTPLDIAGGDYGSTVLTVYDQDIEAIFWYVTSLMMTKLEASDAQLRQWAEAKDGGINRDDNPPRRSSQFRMDQYYEAIAARKAQQTGQRRVTIR